MKSLQTIALIDINSDPASETESQNTYVRQLGEALPRLGWQVDIFTRKTNSTQADIVEHNPSCRTIRLKAGAQEVISKNQLIDVLPEFLKPFIQFHLFNFNKIIKLRIT